MFAVVSAVMEVHRQRFLFHSDVYFINTPGRLNGFVAIVVALTSNINQSSRLFTIDNTVLPPANS